MLNISQINDLRDLYNSGYKISEIEEGYTGSYETVQQFMKKNRRDVQSRASQELIWDPGYAEVDFGEADFYEDTHYSYRQILISSLS